MTQYIMVIDNFLFLFLIFVSNWYANYVSTNENDLIAITWKIHVRFSQNSPIFFWFSFKCVQKSREQTAIEYETENPLQMRIQVPWSFLTYILYANENSGAVNVLDLYIISY
jgi:hypothetical protein